MVNFLILIISNSEILSIEISTALINKLLVCLQNKIQKLANKVS